MSDKAGSLVAKEAEIAALRTRLAQAEDALRELQNGAGDIRRAKRANDLGRFPSRGAEALPQELGEAILDHVSDAVVACDGEQRVTFLNASADRLYGLNGSPALGRKCSEIYTVRWNAPADEVDFAEAIGAHGRWRGERLHVTRQRRDVASGVQRECVEGQRGC